jgi:hypothetical protein
MLCLIFRAGLVDLCATAFRSHGVCQGKSRYFARVRERDEERKGERKIGKTVENEEGASEASDSRILDSIGKEETQITLPPPPPFCCCLGALTSQPQGDTDK